MEHIKEFDFFGKSKSTDNSGSNLSLFLEENWGKIQSIFDRSALSPIDYEVYSNTVFAVSYDPPNNEMPTEISSIVKSITEGISRLIGDPDLGWRFGVDDPFLIRFILSNPL